MTKIPNIGILGTGIYIPSGRITAAEIAKATLGHWSEEAIRDKLGIVEKSIPGLDDGTQEMGVRAAQDALRHTGLDPKEIDLILCIGEEWKEYPLTTSGIYIQEQIGAVNAWAIDLQQRCGTTVAAMKIARDMMIADPDIKTVLIAGGYRNGDFIDYRDPAVSFMYNLAAGAGAIILRSGHGQHVLLGTHIITDGSLARDVGVQYGGTTHPITADNLPEAYHSLRVFDEDHMKARLNEVSMANWDLCIRQAFIKSGLPGGKPDFLAALHFKRSMFEFMVSQQGLTMDQTLYLDHYGHIGQVDQILIFHLAMQRGMLKPGQLVCMMAAGIGYAWGANVIRC
ncbi:MAG: 3-oxoacyl-ACP synthase [Saprospiraceae bacterium]|nr:3-oxoacyl-ACP synthase [Saprospiraceae bacterium]